MIDNFINRFLRRETKEAATGKTVVPLARQSKITLWSISLINHQFFIKDPILYLFRFFHWKLENNNFLSNSYFGPSKSNHEAFKRGHSHCLSSRHSPILSTVINHKCYGPWHLQPRSIRPFCVETNVTFSFHHSTESDKGCHCVYGYGSCQAASLDCHCC